MTMMSFLEDLDSEPLCPLFVWTLIVAAKKAWTAMVMFVKVVVQLQVKKCVKSATATWHLNGCGTLVDVDIIMEKVMMMNDHSKSTSDVDDSEASDVANKFKGSTNDIHWKAALIAVLWCVGETQDCFE